MASHRFFYLLKASKHGPFGGYIISCVLEKMIYFYPFAMNATTTNTLQFAHSLFGNAEAGGLHYVYQGNFSMELTNSILGIAESNLENHHEAAGVKKKVYFIMVESLQNITRHQNDDLAAPGFFIIRRTGNDYYVTSCNTISNNEIELLESKLLEVNSLDQDSLKSHYKDILMHGGISDKGGAGLGLIEMARKSGNKLVYDFEEINDKVSYFFFQTKISSVRGTETGAGMHRDNLEEAKKLHADILKNNLSLVYQGEFTQEVVKCALTMTEGIGDKDPLLLKKRSFLIVVELLQNIFKHGQNPSGGKEGNPGVFLTGKTGDEYLFSASNVILKGDVAKLRTKLELVNSLSKPELDTLYTKVLLEEERPGDKGAGLGLIDLRLKSGHALIYDFRELQDDHAVFTLEVRISPNSTHHDPPKHS